MVTAKKEGKIIPLENMLSRKDFSSQDLSIAYAEAAFFVKYLIEEKDPSKFKELYANVNFSDKKEEIIKKTETVYKQKFSVFTSQWEEYLQTSLGE